MSQTKKPDRKRAVKNVDVEEALVKKLFGKVSADSSEDESSDEEKSETEEIVLEEDADESEVSHGLKAVWHDEDDDNLVVDLPEHRRKVYLRRATDVEGQKIAAKEYEKRLREAFSRTQGAGRSQLQWAKISDVSEKASVSSESDSEEVEEAFNDLVASTGKYITTGEFLPKGTLNARRLNDITRGHRIGKKPVTAVQFHPSRSVVMCAGENGVISLYEVGLPPTEEAFLQDTQFQQFPITTAAFSADGVKVIAGSKMQKYLFSYDLLNGKVVQIRPPKEMTRSNLGFFTLSSDGKYIAVVTRNEINILSLSSMELLCVLSTSSVVKSLQFTPSSSNSLFALTETSEVLIWDIRNPAEMQSFSDDGGVRGSSFRISSNNQFLACGSNTGIVNLYEMKDITASPTPKPVKVFDQLTTRVDDVIFNKDSQILSFSSSVKVNAIRMSHTRSRTVFTNFPSRSENLGRPTVSGFSPNSGYMAIGDTNGYLSMFRLHHFKNY